MFDRRGCSLKRRAIREYLAVLSSLSAITLTWGCLIVLDYNQTSGKQSLTILPQKIQH